MGKFAPSPPPAPPAPAPVPTIEDPMVEQREQTVNRALRRRRGLGQTINTSGRGDMTAADVKRSTLLGE